MIEAKQYVYSDEQGALRIGSTGVSLDSMVHAFQMGHSAETIQDEYPALSLEEVHGAIAYYLANRQEVDEYLERQQKLWNDLRARSDENVTPVVQRLRKLRSSASQENGNRKGKREYRSCRR